MNYVLGDLLKDLSTDNITNADRELFYWQFGKSGSFSTSLFNTISYADINNLTKLSKAFPDEVSAFYNYQNNPTYWDNLCKIMNS